MLAVEVNVPELVTPEPPRLRVPELVRDEVASMERVVPVAWVVRDWAAGMVSTPLWARVTVPTVAFVTEEEMSVVYPIAVVRLLLSMVRSPWPDP